MTVNKIIKLLIEKEEHYYRNAKLEAKFDKKFAKILEERGYAISMILEQIYDDLLKEKLVPYMPRLKTYNTSKNHSPYGNILDEFINSLEGN